MVQIQGAYFKASKQNISNTAYFVSDFFDVSEEQKIRDSWLSMWQKIQYLYSFNLPNKNWFEVQLPLKEKHNHFLWLCLRVEFKNEQD
jgi:hypothetical protein